MTRSLDDETEIQVTTDLQAATSGGRKFFALFGHVKRGGPDMSGDFEGYH